MPQTLRQLNHPPQASYLFSTKYMNSQTDFSESTFSYSLPDDVGTDTLLVQRGLLKEHGYALEQGHFLRLKQNNETCISEAITLQPFIEGYNTCTTV